MQSVADAAATNTARDRRSCRDNFSITSSTDARLRDAQCGRRPTTRCRVPARNDSTACPVQSVLENAAQRWVISHDFNTFEQIQGISDGRVVAALAEQQVRLTVVGGDGVIARVAVDGIGAGAAVE